MFGRFVPRGPVGRTRSLTLALVESYSVDGLQAFLGNVYRRFLAIWCSFELAEIGRVVTSRLVSASGSKGQQELRRWPLF